MSLTVEQLKHLERRLHDERAHLTMALDRYLGEQASEDGQDRQGDLSKLPFHLADQGTETMDRELDASNAARMSAELSEIDEALVRLFKVPETFGICEDTGRDIPFARLDMIPWARTCGDKPPS